MNLVMGSLVGIIELAKEGHQFIGCSSLGGVYWRLGSTPADEAHKE
jgi:hypothetical protein